MKPDFIVIGAQKSASTFVQGCLQDHPDVFLPDGETPFFESPDYENGSLDALQAIFAGRTESRQGIKRPNYIGRPEVPARIASDLPDAKLIAVFRNPVDRAVAAYFHQIKYGTVPPLELEEGMRRLLDDPVYQKAYPRCSEVIEFGYYAKYITLYQQFLQKGALLPILHEDIISDPLAVVRKCYDFLGVDQSFTPPSLHSRPQKVVYSIPRLRFLTLRNRFMHDYSADKTRLQMRNMNPLEWLAVAAITLVDRAVVSRLYASQKPKISAELRARLQDIYASDITHLELIIGRDLSAWTRKEACRHSTAAQ